MGFDKLVILKTGRAAAPHSRLIFIRLVLYQLAYFNECYGSSLDVPILKEALQLIIKIG